MDKVDDLAYMGKRKRLVRILWRTETGAVAQYEPVDEPGNRYMPLIVDGKNVIPFEPTEDEQISMWEG